MDLAFTVNGQPHSLDIDKLTFAEAAAIERVTGEPFGQFPEMVKAGNIASVQAIVWVACKRTEPTLKFSDVGEWAISDVEWDLPDDQDDDDGDGPQDATADPQWADVVAASA